ncbi:MAG: hypothetical protein QM702_10845 [Rubrivivax sp.]
MTSADHTGAFDELPAAELCSLAIETLESLVVILNQETTLLRGGRLKEAGQLTPEKTRLAQDYVELARSVQRQSERLKVQAPALVDMLLAGHDRLATQMAENLKVIATARAVTGDLLADVATAVAAKAGPKTYGASGQLTGTAPQAAAGVSINRAL